MAKAATVAGPTWKRLSVNVADDVADAIAEVSKKHGWSVSDVVRRSVSAYKFIDDEVGAGSKILVERDGVAREVRFVY